MRSKISFAMVALFFLVGCGGTHGQIETFSFNTTKDSVEEIISKIVGNDTIHFLPNDNIGYQDIFLQRGSNFQVFTYHFYGDSTIYWNDNKNQCAISLVYVKDKGKYKSEDYLNTREKNEAIDDFNKHFIKLIYFKLKNRTGL